MDQDMNAYLEQLRARAEKRLQDSGVAEKPSEKPEDISSVNNVEHVELVVESKEPVDTKPSFSSDTSIDELMKELLPDMSEPTKPFDVKPEDLDEESAQMMEDLVAWANRDPTIPFEPISEKDATELHEIVSELIDEAPASEEQGKTGEFTPSPETEKTKTFKAPTLPEEKTESEKPSVFKANSKEEPQTADNNIEDEEPDPRELRREEARARREEKRRARELRKALVDKENGSGRGLIGEILYVILFILLVAVTILAVLYLLQTIAGIKIIDVESLFDLVFRWISNKILK